MSTVYIIVDLRGVLCLKNVDKLLAQLQLVRRLKLVAHNSTLRFLKNQLELNLKSKKVNLCYF